MKKYGNIFKITFITYVLLMIACPYITAQPWADVCLILFILALIYQLLYVIYLRKKENLKFTKVLCRYFVYTISSVSIYIIFDYIDICLNGFTPSDFLGNSYEETYYGFEALKHADWKNLFYIPYLIFNVIILIISKLVQKKGSDSNG